MFHFPEPLRVAGTCHPWFESVGCPGGRLVQQTAGMYVRMRVRVPVCAHAPLPTWGVCH